MATALHESVLGRDIYQEEDYKISSRGDLATVSGVDALVYRIDRMLVTNPGEIFHRPEFGIGIIRFLNQPNSVDNIAKLRNAIVRNLTKDEVIQEVSSVSIRREEAKVIVSISVIAKSGIQVAQDFAFNK